MDRSVAFPQDSKYIAVPIVFLLKEVVNGALFTTISLEFCPPRAVASSNKIELVNDS